MYFLLLSLTQGFGAFMIKTTGPPLISYGVPGWPLGALKRFLWMAIIFWLTSPGGVLARSPFDQPPEQSNTNKQRSPFKANTDASQPPATTPPNTPFMEGKEAPKQTPTDMPAPMPNPASTTPLPATQNLPSQTPSPMPRPTPSPFLEPSPELPPNRMPLQIRNSKGLPSNVLLRVSAVTCVSKGDLFDSRDEYRFSIGGEGYPRFLTYPFQFSMAKGQRALVDQVFPMWGQTTLVGWEEDLEIGDELTPHQTIIPQLSGKLRFRGSYHISDPPHIAEFEYEVIPSFGNLSDPLHPANLWHPDRRRDAYANFHLRLQNSGGHAASVKFFKAAHLVVADLFGWVQDRFTDEPTEWFLNYGNTLVYEMNYQIFTRLLADPSKLFDPAEYLPQSAKGHLKPVPPPTDPIAFDLRMVEIEQTVISQALNELSQQDRDLIDRQLSRLMTDTWLDRPLEWVKSTKAGQLASLLGFYTIAINWAKEWIGGGSRDTGNSMIRFSPEPHRIAIGRAMIHLLHSKEKQVYLKNQDR